jgi:hypothetical protein
MSRGKELLVGYLLHVVSRFDLATAFGRGGARRAASKAAPGADAGLAASAVPP